jgi:hypothetical protein
MTKVINKISVLALFALAAAPSRSAKAGQELSQNLEVAASVSTPCVVSTESGARGAELSGACPDSFRQRLTRDYIVSAERGADGSGAVEQLVLTVLF